MPSSAESRRSFELRVVAFGDQVGEGAADDQGGAAARDVGPSYWIAYFDGAELAGTTGGRLLDLARHNP